MRSDLTEIALIVDRSGSMSNKIEDAIGGFNTLIEDQKKVEGDARVTVVLFDNQIDTIVDAKPINDVALLTRETYIPRGTTSLRDAIGMTANKIGERLAQDPEAERPGKVIIVIITDGLENTSKEFSAEALKELIERQKNEYSWEFLFMGTTEEAINAAQSWGVDHTGAYADTGEGTRQGYLGISRCVAGYRTSGKVDEKDLNQ